MQACTTNASQRYPYSKSIVENLEITMSSSGNPAVIILFLFCMARMTHAQTNTESELANGIYKPLLLL